MNVTVRMTKRDHAAVCTGTYRNNDVPSINFKVRGQAAAMIDCNKRLASMLANSARGGIKLSCASLPGAFSWCFYYPCP